MSSPGWHPNVCFEPCCQSWSTWDVQELWRCSSSSHLDGQKPFTNMSQNYMIKYLVFFGRHMCENDGPSVKGGENDLIVENYGLHMSVHFWCIDLQTTLDHKWFYSIIYTFIFNCIQNTQTYVCDLFNVFPLNISLWNSRSPRLTIHIAGQIVCDHEQEDTRS